MELGDRLIPLSQGYWAIVDEGDYGWLSRWKWHVSISKKRGNWQFKARTRSGPGKLDMHRLILGVPRDFEIDHVNGYALDNRRANLRIANRSQNMANRRTVWAASGLRGVRLNGNRWQARLRVDGRLIHLGMFSSAVDAARAVDLALIVAFGKYAATNQEMGRLG